MKLLYRHCAGLDIHRDSVSACIRKRVPGQSEALLEEAVFGTFTQELERLKNSLKLHKVSRSRWNRRACIGYRSGMCSRADATVHVNTGEPGDGARAARAEDGPHRCTAYCRVSAIWAVTWEFHSA